MRYWVVIQLVFFIGATALQAYPQIHRDESVSSLSPLPYRQSWSPPRYSTGDWKDLAASLPERVARLVPDDSLKDLYAQNDIEEEEVMDDDSDMDDDFEDEFAENEIEVSDPLSGYNRFMTGFNDKLYFWLLEPVASGYAWAIPEGARRSVDNFFDNLWFPIRFVNNLLQFEILDAGEETLRFVVNSTIGILGLFDPAKSWFGLEAHDEDFGQTLGAWGVGAGPHLVLPILGPSNLRDAVALVPDWQLDPLTYIPNWKVEYGVRAFEAVNNVSLHLGEYESLKKDAIDFYPFLRDAYEQNREKKIKE